MGLDTSHGCWHGAYSAFKRWRDTVAEAAGYAVWPVIYDNAKLKDGSGFGTETIMLDWGHITEANLAGVWERPPSDPLIVLFAHSDCDGQIFPEHAGPLADRLQEMLPELEGDFGGHIGDIKAKTQKFIDGLRLAVAANEPVDFH